MAEQIDLQSVLDENDGVVPQEICLKLLMQLKTTNESMSGLEDADLSLVAVHLFGFWIIIIVTERVIGVDSQIDIG